MSRSLIHFWRMNLAVAAGVAITTAVLTGALMVGDSLRGSLQDLTLDRLGRIDQALLNPRFFPADLGSRLATATGDRAFVPVIQLQGSAVHADSNRRASGVQLLGVDETFLGLYPETVAGWTLERQAGQTFPSVILNQTLAAEVGARIGDDVLLHFGSQSEIPSASLMGRREEPDLLTSVRLTVSGVIPASGPGRFGLEARQTRTFNAFVDLSLLQRRLDRRGQVNLLLLSVREDIQDGDPKTVLQNNLRLEDLGLHLTFTDRHVTVESRELVLRDVATAAIERWSADAGIETWPYLTYLANRIEVDGRLVPYSTLTAVPSEVPEGLGAFVVQQGRPVVELEDDQLALNRWAAEDLAADIGDTVRISYYLVGPEDELITESTSLEVGSIVELESLAADPSLTPDVPGVSDAADMAGWDPPFAVDLDLVRPQDEAYWDQRRGTPKAFLSLSTGQRLWRSRYGQLTGVRLLPGPSEDVAALASRLASELPRELSLESAGYRLLPLRAQGLAGASGTTDFAGLFVGFSLFLIVSSALLVGLLFALLVERRGREIGLLLAMGYPTATVRRKLLGEALVLAGLGVLFGSVLAYGYTTLVLRGLVRWWSPVLDAPVLRVHLEPLTLVLGAIVTLILVLLVIQRTVRRLTRIDARRLLAGRLESLPGRSANRLPSRTSVAAVLLAAVLVGIALVYGSDSSPALFFAVGAALLVAGLAAFAAWARRTDHRLVLQPGLLLPTLASRNSARHLGRSLLSVTLVACATFVLVSVSANRKTHERSAHSRTSGTGGFALVAESDIPLPSGLAESGEERDAVIYDFRLLPGDDASCLNLYQPEDPRVLGVPHDFVARGGFTFHSTLSPAENPWSLLNEELEQGVIPAIGDYNSVRWILHSGLGRDLLIESGTGEPLRLRLVGLLQTSIFQSELLISEEMFRRFFPDRTGFAFFLAEVDNRDLETVAATLESSYSAYGLDTASAAARLAGFQAVENMYLTTFEVLGGLGLLLGTVGLGIVLLRNTLERRNELAVLRSFGYRRSTLGWMVVAENAFLLAIGLTIGAVSGIIAVAPHLLSGGIRFPWLSLGGILLTVFLVGLLSSAAAVAGAVRTPLLPALKSD